VDISLVPRGYYRRGNFFSKIIHDTLHKKTLSSSGTPFYVTKQNVLISPSQYLGHIDSYVRRAEKLALSFEPKDPLGACRIRSAFSLANKTHYGQFRLSGEPYIIHPLSVAEFLRKRGADEETVVIALQHDILEDGIIDGKKATKEFLAGEMGEAISFGVDGVTQLGKPSLVDKHSKHVEYAIKNIRVILVKLVDNLHNMKTLRYKKPERRRTISMEALNVYAPLANRLGIWDVKRELEDLAFRWLDPKMFRKIRSKRKTLISSSVERISEIKKTLLPALQMIDPDVRLVLETRCIYEIYQRMQKRNILDVEHLSPADIWRVNVVVSDREKCFTALDYVHRMYHPDRNNFPDHINSPEPNGAQFLHTYVMVPGFGMLLVQIRDPQMQAYYHSGIIANPSLMKDSSWLVGLLKDLRSQMLTVDDEVYNVMEQHILPITVYTDKGGEFQTLFGSTVLDAIRVFGEKSFLHALVDEDEKSLSRQLADGCTLSIRTAENITAKLTWLNSLNTLDAIHTLQDYLKSLSDEEILSNAKKALDKGSQKFYLPAEVLIKTRLFKKYISSLGFGSVEEFLRKVGIGEIRVQHVVPQMNNEIYREELLKAEKKEYAPYYYFIRTLDRSQILSRLSWSLCTRLGFNMVEFSPVYTGEVFRGRREVIVVFGVELYRGGIDDNMVSEIQRLQVQTIAERVLLYDPKIIKYPNIGYGALSKNEVDALILLKIKTK